MLSSLVHGFTGVGGGCSAKPAADFFAAIPML